MLPPVTLQPFEQSHLELLAVWLRQPHVARWYPKPEEDLARAMNPPAGGSQAIIAWGTAEVGYIRWQRVARSTLDALGLQEIPTNSVDVDILLGDEGCVGKGLGPAALTVLAAQVRQDTNVPLMGLTTSIENTRAHRAFEKAGFRIARQYAPGALGPCHLMIRDLRRERAAMHVDLKPVARLDDDERAALRALTAAVYPPDVVAASPGRRFQWAPPDYSVLVSTSEGELVSHVGIVVRAGTLDGVAVKIGGIGSVKTHPRAEGHGYASAGLRRAATALLDDHQVAFSLLVCQEHLLPFYDRLGWRAFSGRLVVEQPAGRTVFTINRPMVLSGQRSAPEDGTIDLNGLPW